MTRLRAAIMAALMACVLLLLGGAGAAAAQDSLPFAQTVPVTGESKNGKRFTGTYTIKRFDEKAGRAVAVGTLKGKFRGQRVTRRGVRMPVTITTAATAAQQPPPVPTPGACPILNLTLGPINLNLLGLRVATNEIRLLVEAIPGPGNLLGNLLCAITNLLNPQAATPLQQLIQVLNALLALAPRSTAATAVLPAAAAVD